MDKRIPGFVRENDPRLSQKHHSIHTRSVFGPGHEWPLLLPEMQAEVHQRAIGQLRASTLPARELANDLIPNELVPQLQQLPAYSDLPQEITAFKGAVLERLLDQTMTASQFGELFQIRNAWINERTWEQTMDMMDTFDQHKAHVVDSVCAFIDATPQEKALLTKRINAIKHIVMADPLLGGLEGSGGYWDVAARTIRITSTGEQVMAVLVHELMHAISSPSFTLTDVEGLFATEAPRLGLEILDRLTFLNEGITEICAGRYFREYSQFPNRPALPDASHLALTTMRVYAEEQSLVRWMSLPPKKFAKHIPEERLEQAVRRATEAGVILDEPDFDELLYRAYFFDEVADGKGRADHWRAWSEKMRDYYGDGVLVALDKVWSASRDVHKDTAAHCLRMLADRFVAKWAP